MCIRDSMITNYKTAKSQLKDGVDGYITELSVEGISHGIERLYNDSKLRLRSVSDTHLYLLLPHYMHCEVLHFVCIYILFQTHYQVYQSNFAPILLYYQLNHHL